MGVWLPDGWVENAPGGFPLTPLIPPGLPFSPRSGERRGEESGVWGRRRSRRLQIPSFFPSPRRAAAAGRGPGGGASPEGQVANMPVYVRVNFLKFITSGRWALTKANPMGMRTTCGIGRTGVYLLKIRYCRNADKGIGT